MSARMPGVQLGAQELVPFVDLKAQSSEIRSEIVAAVLGVLEGPHFVQGPQAELLEHEIARFVGHGFAVGCASGSDAFFLALKALEIGPRDEVITSPYAFVAASTAIALTGARPVFVDIDPRSFNLDPEGIDAALTPQTRAIVPVHLFGLPADMDPILEVAKMKRLYVVEDATQAIGARYRGKAVAGFGEAGCFSFFPSENLGGAGDGGMVVTNDAAIADRLKRLRVLGRGRPHEYDFLGISSMLSELQAAILRVKLRHLEEWTLARQRLAARYGELFQEIGLTSQLKLPSVPRDRRHVYNRYLIRIRQRDELREHLKRLGIPTEIYYPLPLHRQRVFKHLGYKPSDFPNAEAAAREAIAIPMFPELTEENQRAVVEAIASFFQRPS